MANVYSYGVYANYRGYKMSLDFLDDIIENHAEYLRVGDPKLGADFSNADLNRADFYKADLRKANFYKADLRGADLRLANLQGACFFDADLRGADLRFANLRDANFFNANCFNVNLFNADLFNANLRNANLRGADIYNAKSVLSFIGEKNLLIYFRRDDRYYFKIGCITRESSYWLRNFKKIGKENGYTKDQIQIYGDVIKLFSQYDLLNN